MATISIDEDVWQDLNKRKEPGDSFNDVVERLLEEVESND